MIQYVKAIQDYEKYYLLKKKFFLSFLFFLSCNSDSKNNDNLNRETINLNFPDTLQVNKTYNSELIYSLSLDSITVNDISSRYVFLHISTKSLKDLSLSEIKKSEYLSYEDIDLSGNIKFQFKFETLGDKVFNAVIEDIIILKKASKEGKVKMYTKETSISKDLYIIN